MKSLDRANPDVREGINRGRSWGDFMFSKLRKDYGTMAEACVSIDETATRWIKYDDVPLSCDGESR
jgi:hypothetical protein